jgi:hypothetical protein
MPSSRHSPGLRKRQLATDAAVTHTSDSISASAKDRSSIASRQILLVLVSLALSVTYLCYTHTRTGPAYQTDYALCSPDGALIYTVDEMSPSVQCLVVQNEHIVDVGSLGKYSNIPVQKNNASHTNYIPTDHVQEKWGRIREISLTGVTTTPLSIRFIPTGAIVVPGITGWFFAIRIVKRIFNICFKLRHT